MLPLILLGTGVYLAWFGVHYWRSDEKWPAGPVKSVLQGKPLPDPGKPAPVTAQMDADIVVAAGGTAPAATTTAAGGPATGSAISDDALKYQGAGYVWGGPADVPGDWDCSSFVSYVLGHDLGMTLPGGGRYGDPGYPPHAHGPTTLQYMLFGTGVNYGSEQPGDLLVSAEHIGIVIGGGKMISAQDPQAGTGTAGYTSGFPGGQPLVRRVTTAGTVT